METKIFAIRTSANREDQVIDFFSSKLQRDTKAEVYAVIRPHGMRGYVFAETLSKEALDMALQGVPYARGTLPHEIPYPEIEHMLEQVKVEMNVKKGDIVEVISGPFKRENAKVMRINRQKEEIVVELLEAAVPIPITVKMDAVKVIRREDDSDE
jgi:transcription termination/antitermination protein NusG